MSDQQPVIVNNNGCGSGCLPVILVVGALGLAYEYWYVTVPVAVLALLGWVAYMHVERGGISNVLPAEIPPADDAPSGKGGWDIDPRDPMRERWREDGRWTGATRPREDWLPGEREESADR